MSNPRLVKSRYTQKKEKTRVIDNNALAEQRIAAYQEEQRRRRELAQAQAAVPEEVYDDGFTEGLNPDQLEQLTADQADLASADAFADGYDESEIPPDAGMFADADGMAPAPAPAARPGEAVDLDALLAQAQEEAERIVAQAQEDAMRMAEEAKQQGFDQGYAEGMERAKEEAMQQVEAELDSRRRELEDEYQKALDEVEPNMVETLTRIYEHVFDVNLRGEKKIILHLLQTTLSRVEAEGNFIVHLAPADYDHVADEKEMLRASIINPNALLELVEDPLLHENECMIETDGGIFDCSLGVELSELTRKLKLLAFDRRRN